MYQKNYVTDIKETHFEIYTKQVACPFALPLLDTCHYIANCLY